MLDDGFSSLPEPSPRDGAARRHNRRNVRSRKRHVGHSLLLARHRRQRPLRRVRHQGLRGTCTPEFRFRFSPTPEGPRTGHHAAAALEMIEYKGFNTLLAELEAFAAAIRGEQAYPIPPAEILHGVGCLRRLCARRNGTSRPRLRGHKRPRCREHWSNLGAVDRVRRSSAPKPGEGVIVAISMLRA